MLAVSNLPSKTVIAVRPDFDLSKLTPCQYWQISGHVPIERKIIRQTVTTVLDSQRPDICILGQQGPRKTLESIFNLIAVRSASH